MTYVADGLRVVVAGSCCGHDVLLECQTAVKHDTEHLHLISHREIDASYRYWRYGRSNSAQCRWSVLPTCPGSAAVRSAYTTAWRHWYTRREQTRTHKLNLHYFTKREENSTSRTQIINYRWYMTTLAWRRFAISSTVILSTSFSPVKGQTTCCHLLHFFSMLNLNTHIHMITATSKNWTFKILVTC